ncbi:hypothetical protein SVAN01_02130 [Stagonosporopsis vannaccii]|nr:hypothetical protein SVAN01_02130 [Stagonosporopsis vannaccii]
MNRGIPLTLGDTGRPEDRVVRIINLHYKVDIDDIREFFGNEFIVIHFVRAVNMKSNKNTVGYVLFATEQQRINAQMLSGRRIFDREVTVVPAQKGYSISISGDKLQPAYSDECTWVTDGKEADSTVLAAMGDVDAFPSLAKVIPPVLATRAPALVPTRKHNAQERALNNRILFMNNVGQGPEVNHASFSLFFGGYTVVDVKRPLDPKTRTPNPTAFVMLASARERDEALFTLKNVPMQGRKVTLEAPKIFSNVDEYGFVPSSHEDVLTLSSLRPDTLAIAAPPLSSAPVMLARKSRRRTLEDLPKSSHPPNLSKTSDIDFFPLLDRLGVKHDDLQQASSTLRTQLIRQYKPSHHAECDRMVHSNELMWGLSRDELSERYMSQQRVLMPMPSGVEGPGQIITRPLKTPPIVSSSPFPQELSFRGTPPGIDTTFRPREYGWNLGGDQSVANQVISEEAWYGGPLAIQQRKVKH